MPETSFLETSEAMQLTHCSDSMFRTASVPISGESKKMRTPLASYMDEFDWGASGGGTSYSCQTLYLQPLPTSATISDCGSRRASALQAIVADDLNEEASKISDSARNTLLEVTEELGLLTYFEPEIRFAAFAEEDEGASIVFHSTESRRQLTVVATASGGVIAITIDEHMRRREITFKKPDGDCLRDLIRWLKRQD